MRYGLPILILILGSLVEAQASSRPPLSEPHANNQYMSMRYRGYYRIIEGEGAGLVPMFSAPTADSPPLAAVLRGAIVVSEGLAAQSDGTTWLRITDDLKTGWMPIHLLRHAVPTLFPGTGIAISGVCTGQDPVWALSWQHQSVRLSTFPGREQLVIDPSSLLSGKSASGFSAANQSVRIEAIFDGRPCVSRVGDGLTGDGGIVIVIDGQKRRLLTGCCQPAAEAFGGGP